MNIHERTEISSPPFIKTYCGRLRCKYMELRRKKWEKASERGRCYRKWNMTKKEMHICISIWTFFVCNVSPSIGHSVRSQPSAQFPSPSTANNEWSPAIKIISNTFHMTRIFGALKRLSCVNDKKTVELKENAWGRVMGWVEMVLLFLFGVTEMLRTAWDSQPTHNSLQIHHATHLAPGLMSHRASWCVFMS
jgi:hypothetical protein